MDDYPEHLAPEFEEGWAGVKTPFKEWWARVQSHFPNVPENVAEHWLHRHWGYSEYRWLRSKDYVFNLVPWDSGKLLAIESPWPDRGPTDSLSYGMHLSGIDFWLGRYMLEHRDFPQPIIALDNEDGHLVPGVSAPDYYPEFPKGFILIEGHKRLPLACYLFQEGNFEPEIEVWLMTRAAAN